MYTCQQREHSVNAIQIYNSGCSQLGIQLCAHAKLTSTITAAWDQSPSYCVGRCNLFRMHGEEPRATTKLQKLWIIRNSKTGLQTHTRSWKDKLAIETKIFSFTGWRVWPKSGNTELFFLTKVIPNTSKEPSRVLYKQIQATGNKCDISSC